VTSAESSRAGLTPVRRTGLILRVSDGLCEACDSQGRRAGFSAKSLNALRLSPYGCSDSVPPGSQTRRQIFFAADSPKRPNSRGESTQNVRR